MFKGGNGGPSQPGTQLLPDSATEQGNCPSRLPPAPALVVQESL